MSTYELIRQWALKWKLDITYRQAEDLVKLVEEKFTSTNTGSLQCPFLIVERFADNGAHSHWELIERSTGAVEWSQQAGA